MRKSLFNIDGGQVYVGYTSGRLWNGWATPYFPLEEAKKIQAEWNDEYNPMTYDEVNDEFRIHYDGDDYDYIWKGEDIQTVDGKLHLYGIGAYSHIWDELGEDDKRYLAEQISEFIIEHNAEWYEDHYECGDDLLEYVFDSFADFNTFARCYEIMNNARFNSEQIYAKLEEVLM